MSSRRDVRAALVLGLLLAPIAASSAQQICLPATPAAREAITSFLQNSNEAAWRQAHSISATSAEQLQPLTDAADAALCRTMDSTIAESPAYYLRAGSLVIGTTAQPVERRPGVIGGQDLGNDLFVFDSTGRWIHSPGEDAVAAPPDLRAATAIAGNVELRWTNRAAVASYLVRRAVGTGAYAALATVAGTATSYVDATAGTGTYRYQLTATGTAGGTATVSNEVSVTVVDPGSNAPHTTMGHPRTRVAHR
jgi:hypothetical protein